MRTCEVCGEELDQHGRCAECMGVSDSQVNILKTQTAHIVICPTHGAVEATHRPVKPGKRWFFPCPKCGTPYREVGNISIECDKRLEEWRPEYEGRMMRWCAGG